MPRFVILLHELPSGGPRTTHWDLMLAQGEVLRTWALERLLEPGVEVPAEQLPDHRLAYLQYEGPLSGNRGSVTRWDEGEYTLESESPDALVAHVAGLRMRGVLTLRRRAEDHSWRVSFSADPTSG